MTPDDAFLQAILESPDDDTPRLIYADWLEERGNPRGEFIRLQCALAKLTKDDPRRPKLESREVEFLLAHEDDWLGTLRECFPIPHCTFRRGFVESVTTQTDPLVQHADLLFRSAPVNRLCFLDVYRIEEVLSCPLLERVASLDFSPVRDYALSLYDFDDEDLQTLFDSPFLDRLTSLNLSKTNVSDVGIYLALQHYPRLARLQTLYLSQTSLGEEVRTALQSVFGDRVHF